MASSKAHHATGLAAGIIATAIVTASARTGGAGIDMIAGVLALIGGMAGATAPDWLEVAWWTRKRRLWITHRTLTHWGIGWIALLALSYHFLGQHLAAPAAFGFACGGLVHLVADWPNPLGVPWIVGRHSLNLWTSGHCDLIIVAGAWAAALFVVDDVWFHHAYGRMLLGALRL